jgi:hypothetical protein
LYQPARKYLSRKQKQHAIPYKKKQEEYRFNLEINQITNEKGKKHKQENHLENKKIYT